MRGYLQESTAYFEILRSKGSQNDNLVQQANRTSLGEAQMKSAKQTKQGSHGVTGDAQWETIRLTPCTKSFTKENGDALSPLSVSSRSRAERLVLI